VTPLHSFTTSVAETFELDIQLTARAVGKLATNLSLDGEIAIVGIGYVPR